MAGTSRRLRLGVTARGHGCPFQETVRVELRGFEPLTPCMPLTSQPFTHHYTATCSRVSALLSTRMASRSHSATCGDVRLSCWRIAGRSGTEGSTSSTRPPSGSAHEPTVQRVLGTLRPLVERELD